MIWSMALGVLRSPTFWKIMMAVAIVAMVALGWRHYNSAIQSAVEWEARANGYELLLAEKARLHNDMKQQFDALDAKHKTSMNDHDAAIRQIREMKNEWLEVDHPAAVGDILQYKTDDVPEPE